ncbi:hydrolase [Agrobacterium sp. NPDC058088]|uniref:hydrolase n=1 Tax=Agrobacterium sp. NPDC058088 TaxID=3346335 RepID=UPI0036DE9185
MKQALYIVDVQPSFNPPASLVAEISALAKTMLSIATVERHDESVTPFERQLGWRPGRDDVSLVPADRIFIKHGYAPPRDVIDYLLSLELDRVLVCGIQADTCVLAAGFALFDAGLHPTLLPWLTVGSSLDRSGELGAKLWKHHFGAVLTGPHELND